MSKREYNGDPLDMSWKSGPWANNGETISATTDDDTGSMTTTDWPEGATPKEELNEDEIEVIKTAVKHTDITTLLDVSHTADIDRSDAYANYVLTKHWPEGKQQIMERDSNNTCQTQEKSADSREQNNDPTAKKLDQKEIAEARRLALDGSSTIKIADELKVGTETIRRAVKGVRHYSSVPCSVPELEYDRTKNGWYIPSQEYTDNKDPKRNVKQLRQRALNGESCSAISKEYDCSSKHIRSVLKGDYKSLSESSIPPLEYAENEWVIADGDKSQQTLTDDLAEATDTDPQEIEQEADVLEIEPPHESQQTTEQGNTLRQAAFAIVALAIGFLLGRGKK